MGFEVVGQVGNLPNVYQVRHTETHTLQQRARGGGGKEKRGSSDTSAIHLPSHGVTAMLLSHPSVKWAQQVCGR
jgi:hypothetical protein